MVDTLPWDAVLLQNSNLRQIIEISSTSTWERDTNAVAISYQGCRARTTTTKSKISKVLKAFALYRGGVSVVVAVVFSE